MLDDPDLPCRIHYAAEPKPIREHVPLHAHPYCELHYLLQGHSHLEDDQGLVEVRAGDLIYHASETEHRMRLDRPGHQVTQLVLWFEIVDPALASLLAQHFPPRACHHVGLQRQAWWEALVTAWHSEDPVEHYAAQLRFAGELASICAERRHTRPATPTAYLRLRTFIEHHLDAPLRLDAIAAAAGISAGYANRLMQRQEGRSVMAAVTHRRMQRAADALRDSSDSIRAIALAVGYSDPAYFSRCFRRWAGMNPQRFRRSS